MRLASRVIGAAHVLLVAAAQGQQSPTVARAQAAYNELDYAGAILAARQSLDESLPLEGRITAYELLGFSYGALDSTRQAIEAFERLVFLAPDREPDVVRVSPRITSLYASALGRVLVVRRVRVDSTTLIAGSATVPIHFEVSRAALVETRVVGPGIDILVDTQTVGGAALVNWSALGSDRGPLPAGRYQVLVTAHEGERSTYTGRPLTVSIEHAALDTLSWLDSLPGYPEQPELVRPPRDWKPLAVAVLGAGLATGAVFLLNKSDLGTGGQTSGLVIGGAVTLTGLVMSVRRPDVRPSQTNVLYNQLIRELLARRNAEIRQENVRRRQQVLLTVRPFP